MNTHEGLHRIDVLGGRIMRYGAAIGFALWLIAAIILSMAGRGRMGFAELGVLLAFPLLAGGMIRILAWILEGFVSPGTPANKDAAVSSGDK